MLVMNVKTLARWLVMTEFEMLMNAVGLLLSTVLLAIKLDLGESIAISWFHVFLPAFIADALQAYFCLIVFIRQLNEYKQKTAIFRFLTSTYLLVNRFFVKLLVFLLLNKSANFKFQYVGFALLSHLVIMLFRSCSLKKFNAFY